jgi:hypothetical protein
MYYIWNINKKPHFARGVSGYNEFLIIFDT